jgi:glutamate transport system ATP-binding protein
MSLLSIEQLSYAYGKTEVLSNISFTINQGEIVGLLGLSGSGKTTLLKILSGLSPMKSGTYTLEDKPVYLNGKRSKDLPTELGVVFQQFNLFMHLTVVDNLALPLRLRTKQSKGVCRDEALKVLSSLGLRDQSDKYPHECSGGQQQRIAIGRALILKPQVLLIDEPTSSLDQENTQVIIEILKDLHRNGLTLVLITHDMPFAQALCERVIELKDGTIAADVEATTYFEPLKDA